MQVAEGTSKGLEDSIFDFIESKIEHFKESNKIDLIGIATPGNPDNNDLCVKNLVNLGINNLSFKRIYEKYNIPIQIKNDAKAAGLAELKYGALKDYKDAVFLCLGTGIGSAVFLNGNLLQANKHIGFELGHMVIDRNGEQCNCGKKGCFETYCSMKKFKENAKKILGLENVSPALLPEKIIQNINDKDMHNLVNEFIDNLIIGLSNIIDIFEPEAICLGGSFVYFKDVFSNKLSYEMERRKYVFNKESLPKLVLGELYNDAGILGATIT